jgi:hypothetical protein
MAYPLDLQIGGLEALMYTPIAMIAPDPTAVSVSAE